MRKNWVKFKKLIILDFNKDFFDKTLLFQLQSFSEDLFFINEEDVTKRNQLIKSADALLIRPFTKLDKTAIEGMPNLKYIGASSVAVDQVDVAYARSKGITITNLADYSTHSVAEFVFGALLEHIRHLLEARENAKKSDFTVYPEYQGWELKGKHFGILGMGNIGERVGEIAQAFNMIVQYHSRQRKPEADMKGMNFVDLETLFSISDIVGIFLELNDETRETITHEQLNLMKKGAIMISTSSTELFDFNDLVHVLNERSITFIQTYFSSIPAEHRDLLCKIPNAIVYPSIAVQTIEVKQRQQEMILKNLEDFFHRV